MTSSRAPAEPEPAALAWKEFTDELQRIGAKILGPTGAVTARERAEGFRYLARLISAGVELEMEADRRHPVLARMMTPIRSFLGEGTDTLYHEAKLDPELAYRMRVARGDDLFFSAVVYARDEDDRAYTVGHLLDTDLHFEEGDGGSRVAEIHISRERPEGVANWISLDGRQPLVLTRQYFPEFVTEVDRGRYRPAILTIDPVDPQPPPPPYSEDDLAEGLARVTRFMHDTADAALGISAYAALTLVEHEGTGTSPTRIDADGQVLVDGDLARRTPDEVMALVDPKVISNNLPGPGIGYVGATYRLADDEAIRVEGKRVPCRYWSCQIFTRYLESGDYRHHRVALNDRQVDYDADGTFRLYASHVDPGVRNWLSTQGYPHGQIVLRTLLAEGDLDPRITVVKLADIPSGDRR